MRNETLNELDNFVAAVARAFKDLPQGDEVREYAKRLREALQLEEVTPDRKSR